MTLNMAQKSMLAVEAVLDIAYFGEGDIVPSKETATRQGLTSRFLEPVMQELVRHGVLVSVRGPRGGYQLAKNNDRISVGEIVRIVSGMNGHDEGINAISETRLKVVAPFWDETICEFHDKLDATTIADLCSLARQRGVERSS